MSLKALLILGPGIKSSSSAEGLERLIKLYDKEGYLILGDGERCITKQDLKSLAGKIDANTRIDINAHGDIDEYHNHYMHIFADHNLTTKSFFTIFQKLALSNYYTSFFAMFQNLFLSDYSTPLNVHLWSCHGRHADDAINFLPKSSTLTIHGGYHRILSDIGHLMLKQEISNLQQSEVYLSPGKSYLNNIANCGQECHIAIKGENGIYKFSVIPDTREILVDANNFLNTNADKFIEFYQPLAQKYEILAKPNFTETSINNFQMVSFIANCGKNYQIIENKDLLQNPTIASKIINGNIESTTPLYVAAMSENTEIVKLLLEHGGDANKADMDGITPLFMASQEGYVEIVKLLLEHDGDANQANSKQMITPLMMASQEGHIEIVKLLLEHGGDANKADIDGTTSLFAASEEGHIEILKLLLEHGGDANQANNEGATPLFIASKKGHTGIVELLLKCHADISKKSSGITPFEVALMSNKHDTAALLKNFESKVIKYSSEECPSYIADDITMIGDNIYQSVADEL